MIIGAFSFPGATTRLIVRDDVKEAIETSGCTGIGFSKVVSVWVARLADLGGPGFDRGL